MRELLRWLRRWWAWVRPAPEVAPTLPPMLPFDEWMHLTPEQHFARHVQTQAYIRYLIADLERAHAERMDHLERTAW